MTRLMLRDTHLTGAYTLVSKTLANQDEYYIEQVGGPLIVDKNELRRFAEDILKVVE